MNKKWGLYATIFSAAIWCAALGTSSGALINLIRVGVDDPLKAMLTYFLLLAAVALSLMMILTIWSRANEIKADMRAEARRKRPLPWNPQ